jgi:hypothetical protein
VAAADAQRKAEEREPAATISRFPALRAELFVHHAEQKNGIAWETRSSASKACHG